MKKLTVFLTAFLMLLPTVASAKDWTEKVKCGDRRDFSVHKGDKLKVHLEDCGSGSGGMLSRFRPALHAGIGFGSSGLALAVDGEVGFAVLKSLDLIGQVNGRFGPEIGRGFSGGAGYWLSSQFRLALLGGGVTNLDTGWVTKSSGPFAALQGDILPMGNHHGLDITVRVGGGPAWTGDGSDRLVGQWSATIMGGYMW